MKINTFDIDGVILFDVDNLQGVMPNPQDIIVTGRSYEEAIETYHELHKRGIYNAVYFNPLPYDKKTRESSGKHKANIINMIIASGIDHGVHFEDDPVQIEAIKQNCHYDVNICYVKSNLSELENRRRN